VVGPNLRFTVGQFLGIPKFRKFGSFSFKRFLALFKGGNLSFLQTGLCLEQVFSGLATGFKPNFSRLGNQDQDL
jgi:hypothetical protein